MRASISALEYAGQKRSSRRSRRESGVRVTARPGRRNLSAAASLGDDNGVTEGQAAIPPSSFPGSWGAWSDLHSEYWTQVRPIISEIRRLQHTYGRVTFNEHRLNVVYPPHVERVIQVYELEIARIQARIFGPSSMERVAAH
jgi:hypothetical protein